MAKKDLIKSFLDKVKKVFATFDQNFVALSLCTLNSSICLPWQK